ncbi:MAG: Asp23/Gls24 family envelope stress response protein [Oscillospiraceae bacterium]|nr:Asp23/Gls24 family envelope stress response protein [Oscillospiraceae bacterium]
MKLENNKGAIDISIDVFTNIVGDAATRCFGVKGMAGKSKESGLYQLLRRESMSKGVEVLTNDDDTISIKLHIVVEHGVNITTLGNSIMNEVSYKVTEATGVKVKSVDIFVDAMNID